MDHLHRNQSTQLLHGCKLSGQEAKKSCRRNEEECSKNQIKWSTLLR